MGESLVLARAQGLEACWSLGPWAWDRGKESEGPSGREAGLPSGAEGLMGKQVLEHHPMTAQALALRHI